jgi:hypothetical protein
MNRRMARTSETAMTRIPRSDAAPGPGIDALAAIYRRAIERYNEAKEGGPNTASDKDANNSKGGNLAR